MPLERLRDGLLTRDQLPQGFQLLTEDVNSTTTGAPHTPSTIPIASMPCSELGVESFMTTHALPAEDVAVGLERTPVGDEDMGWLGQESLDRYAPEQAAAVMASIRGAVQRCASYTTTSLDGGQTQETASATAAEISADDSLLLRTTWTHPGDPKPFVGETAFVRMGDVILMVQQVADKKPPSDTEKILAAAVKTYRAAGG
ncbi:hypothetical protein [Streptomyces sp. CBMA123]|uniref:hypothetical protein n=1 Tax=Streptomyces sp. CBMA123 TaxID=1896313 RepID=UPI001662044D|nr:hypothetical protein [Streptomyces sp. CBMA123]MBD0691075.1 hypothetical protein [Streptomyces sp. CBMA123]